MVVIDEMSILPSELGAAMASPLDTPQAASVTYVYVPAALSDPIEERTLAVPKGKEVRGSA
jgi:hypothetical protein